MKNLFLIIITLLVAWFIIYHLVFKSPDFIQTYGLTENYIETISNQIDSLTK
jgi:hypothetical protein